MSNYDSDKRKLLSVLCHGSVFLNSLIIGAGVPLAILIVSDDPVVKTSAKESLNFHFNMWLYWAIFGALAWILIGLPFLALVAIANLILPIVAILSSLTKPDESYRYPFIFRIL
ncbi:MAG: DUF4870 domain-containing protein [Coleofasciculaceae cyanobacterium SM2_1_6]|nr:DUF4870 domain-containing protein [Coleofasciculaceae cyanobacterium SM2_1_6]